jgi:hypothetical protein
LAFFFANYPPGNRAVSQWIKNFYLFSINCDDFGLSARNLNWLDQTVQNAVKTMNARKGTAYENDHRDR